MYSGTRSYHSLAKGMTTAYFKYEIIENGTIYDVYTYMLALRPYIKTDILTTFLKLIILDMVLFQSKQLKDLQTNLELDITNVEVVKNRQDMNTILW